MTIDDEVLIVSHRVFAVTHGQGDMTANRLTYILIVGMVAMAI